MKGQYRYMVETIPPFARTRKDYRLCCLDKDGILYLANIYRASRLGSPKSFATKRLAQSAIDASIEYSQTNKLIWSCDYRIVPVSVED